MKTVHIILLSGLIGLSACKDSPQQGQGTSGAGLEQIAYDTIFIEKETGDCARGETNCMTISMQYPLLKGDDSLVQVLNQKIGAWILGNMKDSLENVDALVQQYLDEYNRLRSSGKNTTPGWQVEKVVQVTYNQNGLLCLRLEEFENTGGAHPLSRTTFKNYSLKEGKNLQLNDLFVANYEDTLNTLAEFYFRQARSLEMSENNGEAGFDFKDQKFTLNNNFVLDENGITFVFNAYEIAAYSEGITEFTIPYSEIIESNLVNSQGPLGFLLGSGMEM